MDCSQLTTAANMIVADSAMKPKVWLLSPNVHMLNSGEAMSVTKAAIIPRVQVQRLTTAITSAMCLRDPLLFAIEMSRMLLLRMPRLAMLFIMSMAVLYSPNSPMPAGPIHMATSFVRIMEHIIDKGLHASKHAHGS